MGDMDLVIVLLRTEIVAKHQGCQRDHIREDQLQVFPFEADNKGHDQEVRKIEQVLPRFDPLHIVHDRQVKIEVQYRNDTGQQVLPPQVEMVGDNEDIGGAQVDQRTDVKPKTEIGDNADEMRDKDQENELVKTDRLLSFGRGVILPDPGIDNILIKGPEERGNRVAQR